MIATLDICDSNLQICTESLCAEGPGYALYDDRRYVFGTKAQSVARLRPRDINTRYWWQLNTDKLQPALGPARHTADLVHAHLEELHREAGSPDQLVICAPSSMQRDQLALLLGITQQCNFVATGLIDRSVALASLYGSGKATWHLELQLHQAQLSQLRVANGHWEMCGSNSLPGFGVLQLQERLIAVVASTFIRQTRFDPRRKAASEQSLYDALPRLLLNAQNSRETVVSVDGYQARVPAAELVDAMSPFYDSLLTLLTEGEPMLGDPLTALLPGARERFTGLHLLPDKALAEAVNAHGELLVQGQGPLHHTTTLPAVRSTFAARDRQPDSADVEPVGEVLAATHLLCDGEAKRLPEGGVSLGLGWRIQASGKSWRLDSGEGNCSVNGEQVDSPQSLYAGDSITLDSGTTYQLIRVSD